MVAGPITTVTAQHRAHIDWVLLGPGEPNGGVDMWQPVPAACLQTYPASGRKAVS